MKEGKLRH